MGCFQSQPQEYRSSSAVATTSFAPTYADGDGFVQPQTPLKTWNIILSGQHTLAAQLFSKLKGSPNFGVYGENTKTIFCGNITLFIHWVDMNGEFFPLPTEAVRGIVFVVDATNKESLSTAKESLEQICGYYSEYFQDLMLLILAQGTEEPNAVGFREAKHLLSLRWLPVDGHFIQSCSVDTGEGVQQGLESLIKGILQVDYQLEQDARMQSMLAWSMFMTPMPLF
ncbi:hypothetical protein Gasu2_33070 [Galdieria sulphuraria]|uniref:Small GTP-binding protein Arf1 n=1 Tax=Galdieria sulphuraria TaxID=130081 RepID=M2Y3U6_GALSU|nr:small GTP-binding protein Arf1 [Galdieria sulphuraria]EME30638.1 small GTP-binding protein Arf1 [Galdieria sulphuraria]GJD09035.1 hypothetical protein Gasu2_33070 [Galdieria sulphuraria]|eukprot:XP_005707158.1 small GTP-binding protein Arf1 [Galdieria sulphuraria]